MSYVQTTWVDGETSISADKLNKIENAIAALDGGVISNTTLTIGTTTITEAQLIQLLSFIDASGVEF